MKLIPTVASGFTSKRKGKNAMKGYAPGVYESWREECRKADREDNAKSGDQSRLKQLRERKKKAAKLCQA